jgi:hypothetical protein
MDAIFDLMMSCVVFHTCMIFEDEWNQNLEPLFNGANVTHLKRGLTFQKYMEDTRIKIFTVRCNWKVDWWNICGPGNVWTLSKIKLHVSIMVCLWFFATLLRLCMFQLFSMTCDFLWALVMAKKKVLVIFMGFNNGHNLKVFIIFC